jgi:integrase
MSLPFNSKVKSFKKTGDKYTDGDGMYLLVTPTGKYWRLDSALGQAQNPRPARLSFDNTRQGARQTQLCQSPVCRWHRSDWINKDLLPYLGPLPVSTIKPPDVLGSVQRIEARGALESAHRVRQICGQILRFAVASGMVDRDVSADLKGALTTPQKTNYAAITDPKRAAKLMRAIDGYQAILMQSRHSSCPRFSSSGRMSYALPSIRTDDRCMSESTVNAALRNLGYSKEEMTAHGFRAMARTILDEVLEERVDLIEHQLAHAVSDPNGRAYNRTEDLPARKLMMRRWADYFERIASRRLQHENSQV